MTQANHSTKKINLNVELDADLIQHVNERAAAKGETPADYIVTLLDRAIKQREKNKVEVPASLHDELRTLYAEFAPAGMPFDSFFCELIEGALQHRKLLIEQAEA
jgi:hypothetical protein